MPAISKRYFKVSTVDFSRRSLGERGATAEIGCAAPGGTDCQSVRRIPSCPTRQAGRRHECRRGTHECVRHGDPVRVRAERVVETRRRGFDTGTKKTLDMY